MHLLAFSYIVMYIIYITNILVRSIQIYIASTAQANVCAKRTYMILARHTCMLI